MSVTWKKGASLALAVGAVALVAAGGLSWFLFSPVVVGSSDQTHTLKIRRGMGFNAILRQMEQDSLVRGTSRIKFTAQLFGYKNQIKAGRYALPGGLSSYGLLQKLVRGDVVHEPVTIPEGKTARQIASLLQRRVEIDSARFLQLVNDSAFVRSLGVEAPSLEGFLFPNTYYFEWGMSEEQIIRTMVAEFWKRYDDTLRRRAEELGLSLLEVVTLASIIEGEAMVDSERTVISAVYHNRLRRGMRLQADPTIQYIIEDGPRRLLKRDLEIDSPYNTYRYSGLPPGPINNPGLASIRASLYPADVDYLYFVARGDGSHTFSRTWKEHLRAKAHFDRYRKKVEKMRRGGKPQDGEKTGSG